MQSPHTPLMVSTSCLPQIEQVPNSSFLPILGYRYV
jgi:hypothetical protein